MAETVKCVDCGSLALRNATTHELVEMEAELRSGEIEHISNIAPLIGGAGSGPPTYSPFPICFMRVADFKKEFLPGVRLITVINEERQCNEIVDWHQGFTPKEHREMLDRERMLKWQADRETADREFRQKETGVTVSLNLDLLRRL